jgi:anti-anti-sigma factor
VDLTDGSQFHVELRRPTDEVAVVKLAGEVDMETGPAFEEAVLRAIEGGGRHVIVDLASVTFIDSTALNILIRGRRQLEQTGGSLAVVCGPGSPRRVMEITGLLTVIPAYSALDEALAAREQEAESRGTLPPRERPRTFDFHVAGEEGES